jgi:outer membrane protein OmpA-like peptidoglycan-associated protein
MKLVSFVLCIVLIAWTRPAWSEVTGHAGTAGTIGIGFDEGFFVRGYIIDKVALYGGFSYHVIGADTFTLQPLNRIAWKLGGEYLFWKFSRLNLSAFGEWREESNQGQTLVARGGYTMRYNQWNTIFRAGIRPEYFLLNYLSIDFKLGAAYIHHGPSYKLNATGIDTESKRDDYDELGIYYGRAPFRSEPNLLLNFGVTLYLGNFFKKLAKGNINKDWDKDGIPDHLDKCPKEPEDKDGFEDIDGCPELDNDSDGITDQNDKCPDISGTVENNGCPKTEEISRIPRILQGMNFETDKAVPLASSYPILDDIAKSLLEWPDVKIEIQGHTDNVGTAEYNKDLSQQRAETIRNYLIEKGVSSDRLTAVGYGSEKPITDNSTDEGLAKNRRVELHRTD